MSIKIKLFKNCHKIVVLTSFLHQKFLYKDMLVSILHHSNVQNQSLSPRHSNNGHTTPNNSSNHNRNSTDTSNYSWTRNPKSTTTIQPSFSATSTISSGGGFSSSITTAHSASSRFFCPTCGDDAFYWKFGYGAIDIWCDPSLLSSL